MSEDPTRPDLGFLVFILAGMALIFAGAAFRLFEIWSKS